MEYELARLTLLGEDHEGLVFQADGDSSTTGDADLCFVSRFLTDKPIKPISCETGWLVFEDHERVLQFRK